jgi:hypothetical protein
MADSSATRKAKKQGAKRCARCEAKFGLMTRPHYCKSCDALVCAKCSQHRALVKDNAAEPRRVCDGCISTVADGRVGADASNAAVTVLDQYRLRRFSSSYSPSRLAPRKVFVAMDDVPAPSTQARRASSR